MRVAVIGRTKALIDASRRLKQHGHTVALVWTCPHDDYYAMSSSESFRLLAREVGADFVNDIDIGHAENIARLHSSQCEVAVSVNWLTVLTAPVLTAFPHGVLNAHAGDLPRFRGNAVVNWAILAGEPNIGLCVHRMETELDAGAVYARRRLSLAADTYVGEVWAWIESSIPEMFAETVDAIAAGTTKPEVQSTDPRNILRAYPRRPEDGRIDWRQPVEQIFRLIRASSRPYSGAFTNFEGEKQVIVWRAVPAPQQSAFLAVPGQVCYRSEGDPVIACGDGMLRLTEVEVAGCETNAAAKQLIHRSLRARLG